MDLDGAERLRARPHEGDEEAAGSLGSGLALGDGTDPRDAACLIEGSARDDKRVVRAAHFVAGAWREIQMHNVAGIQTASSNT